jgi:hypothetical protein
VFAKLQAVFRARGQAFGPAIRSSSSPPQLFLRSFTTKQPSSSGVIAHISREANLKLPEGLRKSIPPICQQKNFMDGAGFAFCVFVLGPGGVPPSEGVSPDGTRRGSGFITRGGWTLRRLISSLGAVPPSRSNRRVGPTARHRKRCGWRGSGRSAASCLRKLPSKPPLCRRGIGYQICSGLQ